MYNGFAYIYDRLMQDFDYGRLADYIEKIFKTFGLKPSLVVDLACGTGSLCVEMSRRGYEMIGIDLSPDMLSVAQNKAFEAGTGVLYLNQDISGFELYGTADAFLCTMDSVNYITSKESLNSMFRLVNNYLNPGGLFIFDINSEYKLSGILGGNVFYSIEEDIAYIWENSYNSETRICEFDITFFCRTGKLYRRWDEIHEERAYSVEELKEVIGESDLELEGLYEEMTFNEPRSETERIFFVCRKPVKK